MWPHWLPKGNITSFPLTKEQVNYIKPVFNLSRKGELDGMRLDCRGEGVVGLNCNYKTFMRRFAYFNRDKNYD